MNLTELKNPFSETDVEWRLARNGEKNGNIWAKCVAYITNRAIMERLDEVCGAENWQNDYREIHGGFVCGISIKCGDEWVTKWDGAQESQIEATKGGLSGAMKRAAVQWGIGRYLYNIEEGWAEVIEGGKFSGKTKEGKWFKWNPPKLPDWALPVDEKGTDQGKKITPRNELIAEIGIEVEKAKLGADTKAIIRKQISEADLEGLKKMLKEMKAPAVEVTGEVQEGGIE